MVEEMLDAEVQKGMYETTYELWLKQGVYANTEIGGPYSLPTPAEKQCEGYIHSKDKCFFSMTFRRSEGKRSNQYTCS